MAFSSKFYKIIEHERFSNILKKVSGNTDALTQDIQKLFKRFDTLAKKDHWVFSINGVSFFHRSSKGYPLWKVNVPIRDERLSAKRGARLILAVKENENEIVLVALRRKTNIATGSKQDFTRKEKKDIADLS